MTVRWIRLILLSCISLASGSYALSLPDHPRLFLSASGSEHVLSIAQAKARLDDPAFAGVSERLRNSRETPDMALEMLLTGDTANLEKVRNYLNSDRIQDRPYFRQVMDRARVYDWAYNFFTEKERKVYREDLLRTADRLIKSYLPKTVYLNSCRARHAAVGMIMLNTLGEDPRADTLLAGVKEELQDFFDITGDGTALNDMDGRAAYGGAWPEGYDYDRHSAFYTLELLLSMRSCGLGDYISGSRYWEDKIYSMLYATTPDHKRLLGFEDNDHPSNIQFQDKEYMTFLAAQFHNGHARWWLDEFEKQSDTQCRPFWELLLSDPAIKAVRPDSLPTGHFIPALGLFLMRSSWKRDATFVHFHCGPFYTYHQQPAQGSFSIYRDFGRIVEPGVYDNEVRKHYINWRCRTISHNCLLVYDPQEQFHGPNEIPVPANDGGQTIQKWTEKPATYLEWRAQKAFRQTGTVTFQTTDFSHDAITGESANAYEPGKVKRWCRQLVFIKPDWVVLCDLVVSGNPEFRKTILFHTPDELLPERDGFIARRDGQTAVKIFPLLPENKSSKIEGGPGKTFSYGGTNWGDGSMNKEPDNVWTENSGAFPDQYKLAWRLELDAPQGDSAVYLTVLRIPGSEPDNLQHKVQLLHNRKDWVGLSLDDGKYMLDFDPAGSVPYRLSGQGITFSISGTLTDNKKMALAERRVLLSGPLTLQTETDRHGNYSFLGLQPGRYRVEIGGLSREVDLGGNNLAGIDFIEE